MAPPKIRQVFTLAAKSKAKIGFAERVFRRRITIFPKLNRNLLTHGVPVSPYSAAGSLHFGVFTMFRLFFRSATALCLIFGFLLWKAGLSPENLPGYGGWADAYFDLFRDPMSAAAMLAGCLLLATASACITELLLGLIFSALSAALSLLCLIGFLGAHYPFLARILERFLG